MTKTPKPFLLSLLLFISQICFSQEEFFRSKQEFTTDQLDKFFTSVSLNDNLVLFIANDYKLYAYEKATGKELWVSSIEFKTTRSCFVSGDNVFTPYYSDKMERTAILDAKTGNLLKLLPVGPLDTKPMIRNGILFGTAIYEGGNLFAYDFAKDTLLWWRFLAHGVSVEPYYFADRIMANAEGNNWVSVNYNGKLADTLCKKKADIFVSDIRCVKVFSSLSHDNAELTAELSETIYDNENAITRSNTLRGKEKTFVLYNDILAILGNKKKILEELNLPLLVSDTVAINFAGLTQLLGCTDQTVSFLYNDQFFIYDHQKQEVIRQLDLINWEPATVLLDGSKLWLISREDGLLYGLTL